MQNKLIADIQNAQLKQDIPDLGQGETVAVQATSRLLDTSNAADESPCTTPV